MDRGAWQATVSRVAKSQTTGCLSLSFLATQYQNKQTINKQPRGGGERVEDLNTHFSKEDI